MNRLQSQSRQTQARRSGKNTGSCLAPRSDRARGSDDRDEQNMRCKWSSGACEAAWPRRTERIPAMSPPALEGCVPTPHLQLHSCPCLYLRLCCVYSLRPSRYGAAACLAASQDTARSSRSRSWESKPTAMCAIMTYTTVPYFVRAPAISSHTSR